VGDDSTESTGGASASEADEFEDGVADKLKQLRILDEARRRLHEEQNPVGELPEVRSLAELLAQKPPAVKYRVEGLAPAKSRTLINAQFKAGKTTLMGNRIRSVVDGDDFLGQFPIHGGPLRVCLRVWNFPQPESRSSGNRAHRLRGRRPATHTSTTDPAGRSLGRRANYRHCRASL
jgi:AAA domain